jgi:hypothetical protein
MTWMKPGAVFQCWDTFYGWKQGPQSVIVEIDGPCTCTHIVAQINQLGAKPLPEHYHLECHPLNGRRTEDTKFWHNYVLADGSNLSGRWRLEHIVDAIPTVAKMETVGTQLTLEF